MRLIRLQSNTQSASFDCNIVGSKPGFEDGTTRMAQPAGE